MSKLLGASLPVLATLITGCAVVSDDPGSPPAAAEHAVTAQSAIAGLPHGCVALADNQAVTLDLEAETITTTPDFMLVGDVSSLGMIQDHLVACGSWNGTLQILDQITGQTTTVDLPCEGVTTIGDKVYVQSLVQNSLHEYANLRALIAKTPTRALTAPYASRIGAGNGRLIASWHSADEILAVDLETGASTAIPLPGYDGWIFGLFENASVRLVAGGWVETGINIYDTQSGQQVGRLFDGVSLGGLTCPTAP
jgi:WD40 repeat protein